MLGYRSRHCEHRLRDRRAPCRGGRASEVHPRIVQRRARWLRQRPGAPEEKIDGNQCTAHADDLVFIPQQWSKLMASKHIAAALLSAVLTTGMASARTNTGNRNT